MYYHGNILQVYKYYTKISEMDWAFFSNYHSYDLTRFIKLTELIS